MSSAKPTALVIAFSDLKSDPRVDRQLAWLQDDYNLVAVGVGAPTRPGVVFHGIDMRPKSRLLDKLPSLFYLLTGQTERFYWRHAHFQAAADAVADLRPDVIIANDLDALPVALRVAHGAPVIFDAHEFAPREFEDVWFWRMLIGPDRHRLCKRLLPRTAAMMTVCDGIAEAYRAYGVDPIVITNAPAPMAMPVRPTDPARIRMIHHGAAIPSRRMETMIDLMGHLDGRFSLDLMLVSSNQTYLDSLKQRAAAYPSIRFVDPVPFPEIVPTIADYDIGLFLLEPTNFNYAMALPNKFFEFLQARLAIAIGPSPEMARLVERHDCGVVAPDFDPVSLARLLNALTPERIDHYKQQADGLARTANADANRDAFLQLVSSVRR
jgi:hypothetical protein